MERKKLLLVAISVGVFLVVIISASILIFTPKAGTGTAFSASRPISAGSGGTLSQGGTRPPASVGASDMAQNAGSAGEVQKSPMANASQETNFYINGERPDATYTVEKNTGDASAKVTINIPKPSSPAVPDAPAAKAPQAATGTGRSTAAAPAASPAKSPAKPAAAKPAAVAAAKPAAAASARTTQGKKNDYWVQTGAFSTLVRAEGVKETLSAKGITSIIENRVVDGKTWYRVRVGPYTSETEANYWLALVRSIDGFADSQVRQTVAAK